MTSQSKGTTEVQHGEPISFMKITYRSKNNKKTAVSPKPNAAYVTIHKSWAPRTHCTAFI